MLAAPRYTLTGKQPPVDVEGLERGNLLGFGGKPRQAGMIDDVVEREQAPHEHLWRGVAAVADVLGSERPVDPPREDAAHAADPADAGHGLLGGQALRDQGVDDAPHLFGVRFKEPRALGAGERAAVEADERDPPGLFSRPAEWRERLFASLEVDDRIARRRVELLLPRLHARNGEDRFARKSTRRKRPKCL